MLYIFIILIKKNMFLLFFINGSCTCRLFMFNGPCFNLIKYLVPDDNRGAVEKKCTCLAGISAKGVGSKPLSDMKKCNIFVQGVKSFEILWKTNKQYHLYTWKNHYVRYGLRRGLKALTDLSAKNVIFFWTAPLRGHDRIQIWCMLDVRYGPQSPSFPQKLATALKIHTLHSTTHVYHRCLGINTVITLNLIVSNRLLFPEYTSS